MLHDQRHPAERNSSVELAHKAAQILADDRAMPIAKQLAASVLSQAEPGKHTGAEMQALAAHVLSSTEYDDATRSLAGSVLSQAERG